VTFQPFKVIDFGTNQKHVCDLLFVCHSNLGPILHRFGDIAGFLCSWPHPYSNLILGCSHCTRCPCWGQPTHKPKLFGCEIIFEEFQPMWSWYVTLRMDRRYTVITLCIASHSKKYSKILINNYVNWVLKLCYVAVRALNENSYIIVCLLLKWKHPTMLVNKLTPNKPTGMGLLKNRFWTVIIF